MTATLSQRADKVCAKYIAARKRHSPSKAVWNEARDLRTRALKRELKLKRKVRQ